MAKRSPKISKEELEQDEVLDFADHALFWLREHVNHILTVIALLFVGYAVFIFFHQRQESQLAEASNAFYTAQSQFDRTLAEHEWATEERTQAMREVVAQADNIISQYGDTRLARNALFLKGNAYYFAGDGLGSTANTEEAIRIFEEYEQLAREQGDGFEQAAALLALGYAHENLFVLTMSQDRQAAEQSLVAAANYYDEVVESPEAGFLRYEAMNAKGRLLQYLGREDEAKEIFKQVAQEAYKPLPPPPGQEASQRDQIMYQLKNLANQFTTGRTALIHLQRMGVETEEF